MTARYCEAVVEEPGAPELYFCYRYVGDDTTDVGIVFHCMDESGQQQYVALCDRCYISLKEQGLVLNGTKP